MDLMSQTDCDWAYRFYQEEGMAFVTQAQLCGMRSLVLRESGDCTLVVGIEAAPEWATRARVRSVAEEPLELAHVRLVFGDPEGLGAAAEEAAGTFRSLREVILAAPHDLLGVVAPGQGHHRREAHHRRGTPATPRIGDAAVSGAGVTRNSYDRREKPCKWLQRKW